MSGATDFWFYIAYVIGTTILYATCVTTIFFVVSKSNNKGLSSFTSKHSEVFKAITIVLSVFIILEVFTEFVMAVVWTVQASDPLVDFTLFLATLVYYSPGIFSLFKIGQKIYLYYSGHYDTRENRKNDTLFKCFVWITSYFVYILLYSFFPTFIIAFAYPTRVITVFVFIATFMILSVVYFTTYISKGVTMKACNNFSNDHILVKCFIWCVMCIFLVYFFVFVFALLYALVIGKASVVTSAPLAILSLLPSIIISIAAWLLKSIMLENDNADYEAVDHETDSEDATHTNNAQTKSQIHEVAAKTLHLEESDDQNEEANIQYIPLEQPILQQREDSPTSDMEMSTKM